MFVYLRNKSGLVETTSLLKKEEMTPRLGGSTDVLLIDGQSFFSSKMVKDEHFLSSLESGLRFLTEGHFQFRKWSRSNGHFCNENGSMDC